MQFPIGLKQAVAVCILRSDAGFLLLHRSKAPHIGKYIPVGGRLDPHETPEQAVIREIYEEAGVIIDTVRLCGIVTETSPVDYNFVLYVYTAESDAFTPPDCDEGRLEWVQPDRIARLPIPETDPFIYDFVLHGEFFVFDAIYDDNIKLVKLEDKLNNLILYALPQTQK